jgi:phosphoglycerate dehydrogenase-like enzyme
VIRLLVDVAVHQPTLARLRALPGVEIDLVDPPEERRRPLPAERLRAADVLFCSLPPENHSDLVRLRWIQLCSAGYSQLFGLGLAGRGIRAANARGTFDAPIAEWNVAMMVNLARDLRQMIRNQESRVWDRSAVFQREVRGLTVGIWGYGGIGRETARLSKAMGMRVFVLSRNGVGPVGDVYALPGTGDPEGRLPDRVFLYGSELEFLADLDFLVLAMPLTPATEGIVGERELRALPSAACLLNPARGPLVREEALLRALREGWIAAAALDTHYQYPLPPDHPLWDMPNVILTPHISGSSLSPSFRERVWDIFARNVERHLAGLPLLNEVAAAQLDVLR